MDSLLSSSRIRGAWVSSTLSKWAVHGQRSRVGGKTSQADERTKEGKEIAHLLRFSLLIRPPLAARDHLASERTYLAWLRTSLAFCSVGVGESISFISLFLSLHPSFSALSLFTHVPSSFFPSPFPPSRHPQPSPNSFPSPPPWPLRRISPSLLREPRIRACRLS